MSYDDYKWYLKAIEALCQHDKAVAKIEKMYNNTRKDLKMNALITPEHQVKVYPYGGVGYFAGCTCGWTGTVHGRELDASEDGRSHQMMYAWDKPRIERYWSANRKTILTIWNQAVDVLRQDDYKVTQSSRNYATALSRVGLGSPADETENAHQDCDCYHCCMSRSEAEYERIFSY